MTGQRKLVVLQNHRPQTAFGQLAEAASPWNFYLIAGLPYPPAYSHLLHLLKSEEPYYNAPDKVSPNMTQHYTLFEESGLIDIIKGIVRASQTDYEGTNYPFGFERVRSWPEGNRADPPLLMVYADTQPKKFLGGLIRSGGRELVQVFDENNRLVLSSEGKIFHAGDWVGKLLVEYNRLRDERQQPDFDPCRPRCIRPLFKRHGL